MSGVCTACCVCVACVCVCGEVVMPVGLFRKLLFSMLALSYGELLFYLHLDLYFQNYNHNFKRVGMSRIIASV